jgi:hypothetical protein
MQATAGWVRELPTRIGRRGAWRHRRPGAGGLGDHRGVGCAGGSCRAVVVDGLIARVRRRSRSPCPCGDTVRLDEGAEGVPRPASHRRASRRRPAALRHQPQPDCSPDAGSRPPTSTVRVGRTMRSRQPWRTDDLVPRNRALARPSVAARYGAEAEVPCAHRTSDAPPSRHIDLARTPEGPRRRESAARSSSSGSGQEELVAADRAPRRAGESAASGCPPSRAGCSAGKAAGGAPGVVVAVTGEPRPCGATRAHRPIGATDVAGRA